MKSSAAVALHFLYYNFARLHKTLRITPAMAAGLADHILEPRGDRASGQLTGLSVYRIDLVQRHTR